MKIIHNKKISTAIAILIYLFVAICLTWPFVIKPTTTLTAPLDGDVSNSVTKFDAIKTENINPFTTDSMKSVIYPDGAKIASGVDRVSFFSTIFYLAATWCVNSTFAHSLLTFLGFFLTATVTFLFVRRFTQSFLTGFFAGLISCTYPLFISLAMAAPVYMHAWIYILPIWAFINLAQEWNKKHLALAALSIVPGIFWTPYFTLHTLVIAFACLAAFYVTKRQSLTIKKIAVLIGLVAFMGILCLGYYVIGMSAGSPGVPNRTIEEAYTQSSHPLMYLLPPFISSWGEGGYNLLVSLVPRALYANLYLGISTIALMIVGIYALVSRKITDKSHRLLGIFGISIALSCFLFSLAPTISIFGLDIPTPNYIVVNLVPALRAGQRFTAPLMVGVIVLASLGVIWILSKIPKKYSTVFFAALLTVVCLDLSTRPLPPLFRSTQMPQSAAATYLQKQPKGLVATYTHNTLDGKYPQEACQLKIIHQMPVINWCALDTKGTALAETIVTMPIEQQIPSLHDHNIEYLILDKDSDNTIRSIVNPYYHLLASDENYFIYKRI